MYGYYAFMLEAKAKQSEILLTMWNCDCTTLNKQQGKKNTNIKCYGLQFIISFVYVHFIRCFLYYVLTFITCKRYRVIYSIWLLYCFHCSLRSKTSHTSWDQSHPLKHSARAKFTHSMKLHLISYRSCYYCSEHDNNYVLYTL